MSWLMHYASEYYDPQKAHEYYEAHKKLKGRKSTSSLNDTGQEAASYVKEQIDAEEEAELAKAAEEKTSKLESALAAKEENVEEFTSQANRHIEQLRLRLKNMSAQQKKKNSAKIQQEIQTIQQSNAQQKQLFIQKYGTAKESITSKYNTTVAGIKSEAEEKYLSELDKIKEDKSMVKGSSSSSTSSSSAASSSSSKTKKDPFEGTFSYKKASRKYEASKRK